MNPFLILGIVGGLILVGNIIMVIAIARACNGYEDEYGFHSNPSPKQ